MSPVREKLENLKFVIMLLFTTALVLSGMYLLNDIVLTIRLSELQASIRESNRELSRADFLAMAARFRLFLHLYRGLVSEKELDREELDMIYLSTSSEVKSRIVVRKYGEASKPVIGMINAIRFLLGKPAIESVVDNRSDGELAVAYYFERNKQFGKALSIYDDAIAKGKILDDRLPVVLLHQGFCDGVVGEYEVSKSIFIRIIKNYHSRDESTAAGLMLQYLEIFLSEIEKVKKSAGTALDRADKLYRLMAYGDALSALAEADVVEGEELERKKYLEARCKEETGGQDEAVRLYQEIVSNNPDSDSAKDANRRILVISSADDDGGKIKALARKNNELTGDPEFEKLADMSDKIDSNREKLASDDRDYLERRIRENTVENAANREKLDAFVDEAIVETEKKIARVKLEASRTPEPVIIVAVTAMPAPRVTFAPQVRKTPVPTSESVPVPSPTKQPPQPFTRSFMDESGNVTKVESYDAEGNLEMTIYYEYDYSGNPVRIRVFDKDGKPMED